jgi:hypothetical protein
MDGWMSEMISRVLDFAVECCDTLLVEGKQDLLGDSGVEACCYCRLYRQGQSGDGMPRCMRF